MAVYDWTKHIRIDIKVNSAQEVSYISQQGI